MRKWKEKRSYSTKDHFFIEDFGGCENIHIVRKLNCKALRGVLYDRYGESLKFNPEIIVSKDLKKVKKFERGIVLEDVRREHFIRKVEKGKEGEYLFEDCYANISLGYQIEFFPKEELKEFLDKFF